MVSGPAFPERWRSFLSSAPGDPDVLTGAFVIARVAAPGLDEDGYRRKLAAWGRDAAREVNPHVPLDDRLRKLAGYFIGTLGFGPNTVDYYDPRNSLIHDVIDRRIGIPITLCLVYREIGRTAGLRIDGIGMPGRFIVEAVADSGERRYVDVFGGARVVTVAECRDIVQGHFPAPFPFSEEEHLRPVSGRQFLARMLANLKIISIGGRDWEQALMILDALLALNPDAALELRDRGLVKDKLGDVEGALDDLGRYLVSVPDAPDAGEIEERRRSLEVRWSPRPNS